MIKFVSVLGIVLLLCGCQQSANYLEIHPDDGLSYDEELVVRKNRLHIKVSQIPSLNIVSIEPRVKGGVLYLHPTTVPSGGDGVSRFAIDLNRLSLAKDWYKKVFWVEHTMENVSEEPIAHCRRVPVKREM